MKLIFENWRQYVKEGKAMKLKLPQASNYEGNWEDTNIGVAAKDVVSPGPLDPWVVPKIAPDLDITSGKVTNSAQNFALLLDKLAEFLKMPEPIITSGYRDAAAQRAAMLYIWQSNGGQEDAQKGLKGADNRGSQRIIDLYTECATKGACPESAPDTAEKLTDLWEENVVKDVTWEKGKRVPAVSGPGWADALDLIKIDGGISKHQTGESIDYGLLSNSCSPGEECHIKEMLNYIEDYKLAKFDPIDETGSTPQHWHITVYGITPEGIQFLETPNSEITPEPPSRRYGTEPKLGPSPRWDDLPWKPVHRKED